MMNIDEWINSSYLSRYIFWNAVNLTDYKVFPARQIQNAAPVFQFFSGNHTNSLNPNLQQSFSSITSSLDNQTVDQFLAQNGTVAFLVLKTGSLLFEQYYNGYNRASICTSFSTVKSFVSALIGIALAEKLIKSLDDPITKYLPELRAPHWSSITLRHLVSMSSGLRYRANRFLPWDDEPRVYYSLDLRALARQASKAETPGMHFHYNNYNLVLLGMILERVTSSTVSHYLQEKIWKPLGMKSQLRGASTASAAEWKKWKAA